MIKILNHEFLILRDWFVQPRQPSDCYTIGLLLLIAGGLIEWLLDVHALALAMLWLGAIILVGGFCWEIFRKFRALLKIATLGTIIVGIPSSALVVSIAIVIAEQLVNEATLTSPVYFRNSTNIMASLAVPFVLAFFFAAGLMIYNFSWLLMSGLKQYLRIIFSPFRKEMTANVREKGSVELGRMIAAALLSLSIFSGLATINGGPDSGLQMFVRYLVAIADHYPSMHCAGTNSGERYRLIDKDLLSVVSVEPDIRFSQRKCDLE